MLTGNFSSMPAESATSPELQSVPPTQRTVSSERKYAIGVDYGTNSCRAVLVDTADGSELAEAIYGYKGGEDGVYLSPQDPNVARQDPREYAKGFVQTVRQIVQAGRVEPHQVVGIGIDTTGSSPMPTNAEGVPLGMLPEFEGNLDAMCWLWKDHTSYAEAAEITDLAARRKEPYLAKCGGTYSSEWFWSKILHCARVAPEVFSAATGWTECADFVPALITGTLASPKRSITAAGHKAMYSEEWGGLPSEEFLSALDPRLGELRGRLYDKAVPSDQVAGELTEEYAREIGLRTGIPVAVGSFDAHMGAVGSGIRPGTLVKIIGTSTCDCMVGEPGQSLPDIPGVCGVVPGSVIPGLDGVETGQSAVGDIFNWFVKNLAPEEFTSESELVQRRWAARVLEEPGDIEAIEELLELDDEQKLSRSNDPETRIKELEARIGILNRSKSPHERLTWTAEQLEPGESGLLALDWNNGNRTILVDPLLTGLIVGQTLSTSAPEVYRTLIEATAFGSRRIIERVEEYGVPVNEVVNCGGIAEKSAMTMQIYADVLNKPMKVSRSSQTPALGAAIFGSLVGGAHKDLATAQRRMTGTKERVYHPIPENVAIYRRLYGLYLQLHDAFGTRDGQSDLGNVMKDLIAIRTEVRAKKS